MLGRAVLRFGPYEVDRQSGELRDSGRKLKLQDQPFQILAALLERPGEVVTREDLRQRLWPGDTFVDFDNSVNIAIRKLRKALNDDATQPRFIETLPKRGYRFIAPVESTVVEANGPAKRDPWWRRVAARGALGLAVLAVVWGAYVVLARFAGPVSAGVRVRPAVAIIGFRNLATKSDRAWVSTALAEMLASELAGGSRLRTVPGENVARARIDLALPDTDSFSAPTLGRLRKNLGADFVLTGSYFDAGTEGGGRLRLDLRLQDARDGETLWTSTESGSEADLPDLVTRAGMGVRTKLGVAAAGQSHAEFQAAAPPTSEAAHLYAEGLTRLRQFDARGARDLLERAVATAPEYAPAHAALAAAWSALGYSGMARQEASKARDLAAGLPRAERLSIEARFQESAGQWDKAVTIYRQLGALFPDEPDYGLRCAAAQVKAGRGKEALATVEMLRAKPAAVRDDAAIDYAQSLAANQTGDFPQAQAAAARAAAQAANRGEGMLVADARLLECRELEALGRMAAAQESCETAKGLYARAGDRAGAASATGYLAAARAGAGDHEAAQKLYQTALSIQRDIGNQGGALWDLNGLASELWAKEDLAGARGTYTQALSSAQEIKSRPDAADARANIGATWLEEGNLAEARMTYEHALAEFREMADSSGVANALNNLGETLYLQGDLTEAAQRLEEALRLDRRSGEKGETADALDWSGRVRLAAGDAEGARARYEESLKAWREMGEAYAAPVRVRLAELELESGRAAAAEAQVRDCLAALEGRQHARVETAAHTLLARVLLAEGKRDEARRELERAAPTAAGSQSRVRRLEFAIVAAGVRAAGGKADAAASMKALEAAMAEAHRYGFVGLQFEAELALADVERAAGREASSLGRLRRLEREAQARGFLTIARGARKRLA
jgi:DNA-binding winged helix-turn-helix (wHTH) protein/tetratricopeptide (TPR) repeat protein/TolB-like protein